MLPVSVVASATLALPVLWLALAAWVVVARLRYDRGQGSRERDARLLAEGADPTGWRRRRLERLADGDPGRGAAVACFELVRRDSRRLRRRARERSFRRTQALRILTAARPTPSPAASTSLATATSAASTATRSWRDRACSTGCASPSPTRSGSSA